MAKYSWITSWAEANAYLGRKKRRPLPGRSTFIRRELTGAISVYYHNARVVTYHWDGRIELRHGGWQTSTTKDRLNTYSPAQVCQRRGVWWVAYNGKAEQFVNGMVLIPPPQQAGELTGEVVEVI